MGQKLTKLRSTKYAAQKGLCYYCRQPMWVKDGIAFCKIHRLSARFAARLQCTAEHLVARCDGGHDGADNIVAACLFCNRTRHLAKSPLSSDRYGLRVRGRLLVGKWHGFIAPTRQKNAS